MSCTEGLAVTATGGRQLHYPAGAAPGLADVRWCLFCPQHPGDAAAVADLVIACQERDVTLSMKLAAARDSPLMVLPCGLASLGDRQTESSEVGRDLAM